jgi:TonB family protein
VSDPDESAPFGSERSTLVSMGERRFWFFRQSTESAEETVASPNGNSPQIFHSMLGDLASLAGQASDAEAPERAEERPASKNADSPQIFHSMLGDLASRAGSAAEAEAARAAAAADEDEPRHSLLSLDLDGAAEQAAALALARAAAVARTAVAPQSAVVSQSAVVPQSIVVAPSAAAPRFDIARSIALGRMTGLARPADGVPLPLTQHSTIAELAGLEEHVSRAFPIERAILISLVAHVLLVVLMLFAPGRSAAPQGNLIDNLADAMRTPKDDTPIPAFFSEAPGAPRPNPNRSPLSDADRLAGGGDRSKPKADTPFIPRGRGIEGLAPGPRAPRIAGSAPSRPKSAAQSQPQKEADQRAANAQKDATAETKPSEFPTNMRPQLGSGPKEVVKLTRNELDAAIRDAARGTVASAGGGEGGAPLANEDGGFVDVGGVSFETSWYDWGPYAAEMLRRIKLHWKISRDLLILQQRGTVRISFSIMADGSVTDVKIVRPSTIPPYTHAAAKAIVDSDPFRPLPKDLLQLVPGKDRERIVIHFIYFPTPEEMDGRHDDADPGQ